MFVYSTSLLEDALGTKSVSREADFSKVLDAALEPALEMCTRMGEMRALDWDRNVFGVNCLEAVLNVLEGFDFADVRREKLFEVEAENVENLTKEHVSRFSIYSSFFDSAEY